MKKLLLLLSVITGCLGVAFADNHGKSNDSKDVEEVTNAVLKMYEMANNKKHSTSMISDKGSYQFWSSGGFLKFSTSGFSLFLSFTFNPKYIDNPIPLNIFKK